MAASGACDVGVARMSGDDGCDVMSGGSIAGFSGVPKRRHGSPQRWGTHWENLAVEFECALGKEAELVTGNGPTLEPDDGLSKGLGGVVTEDG